MRIGTECGEDTRYISTLECICYLHTEKAEIQIENLTKCKCLVGHRSMLFDVKIGIIILNYNMILDEMPDLMDEMSE